MGFLRDAAHPYLFDVAKLPILYQLKNERIKSEKVKVSLALKNYLPKHKVMIEEAETAVMQLQAKDHKHFWLPQEAREKHEADSPSEAPKENQPWQHLDFRLPDPQTKNINFCCFKHPLKNDLPFEEAEIDISVLIFDLYILRNKISFAGRAKKMCSSYFFFITTKNKDRLTEFLC